MLGEVCPVVVSKLLFQQDESPSNGGPNYEALKVETLPYGFLYKEKNASSQNRKVNRKNELAKRRKSSNMLEHPSISLYNNNTNLKCYELLKSDECGQSAGKAR